MPTMAGYDKYMNENTLVTHHTKYLEIDGIDEVIYVTRSEHRRIHGYARRKDATPKNVYLKAKSRTHHKRSHYFAQTVGTNVRLFEVILENLNGSIAYTSCFVGSKGMKLINIRGD